MKRALILSALVVALLLTLVGTAIAGPMPGAIFTTLEDGSRVNANIYEAKEDVYLDGGPGVNAPVGAAALDPGDYYFQVTDPSGKVLLSEDSIECRMVHVNEAGVIDLVYPATCMQKIKGQMVEVDCTHASGVDVDHAADGAITVQLMPYSNTPNPGGVYKVWITPVSKYAPGEGFHGFLPAWSKTDNYKVKSKKYVPPITVRKFHDLNANGVWDMDTEPELNWAVDVTDPLGVVNTVYTPATIWATPYGLWSFLEATPAHWMQTAAYVDGVPVSPLSALVTVMVTGSSGETHEVVFGNIQLGCVEAEKFYDADGDGEKDDCEQPVVGIKFHLTGTAVDGSSVDCYGLTGANGKVCWCDLLPGDYVIEEVLPCGNWIATTPTCVPVTVVGGETAKALFGNVCFKTVDFNTKGFWHNKNGLDILAEHPEWIAYVNSLAPYTDNPFDGLDADGKPVPAAQGPAGDTIAAEGTALAEISNFLVANNSEYQQLQQQLLAFIFNVKATGSGSIEMPDGSWVSAESIIASAIDAWNSGDVQYYVGLLDGFNNNDAVKVLCATPCNITY